MKLNRKPTIAYLAPFYFPYVGGAEISLQKVLTGLKRANQVNTVLITSLVDETGTFLKGKDKTEKNIIRVGFSKNTPITKTKVWKKTVANKLVQKLVDYAKTNTVDVIYLNYDLFLKFPNVIKKLLSLNKPVVIKAIYMKSFETIEQCKTILTAKQNKDKVFVHCISKEILEYAKSIGFAEKQLFVCPNPIDTKKFDLKTQEDRDFLVNKLPNKISKNDVVITFTGRFAPQKNIPGIVDIFTQVEKHRNDVKLLMIGYVSYPEMIPIVEELKTRSKNIIWLDKVSNNKIGKYLKASDMFILASKDEGMSNSLLEAMSSGLCPLVPNRLSGIKELVETNKTGITYNLDNTKNLIKQLSGLTKVEIKKLGIQAQKKVDMLCSINKVAEKHADFHTKLSAL